MRILASLLLAGAQASAQPSPAAEDLERRADEALSRIHRAVTWAKAASSQAYLRGRLEQALNLSGLPGEAVPPYFLYLPRIPFRKAPAAILVRPHEDPSGEPSRLLPAAIAAQGIAVIEVNAFAHHSRFDRLTEGVSPQALIQRDVRLALAYLQARTDIDGVRIALVGQGLAATIAASLNPELSSVVLLDGAPDFAQKIREFRALKEEQLDSCLLIHGLIQFAGADELLSLIVPRPLLLMAPASPAIEHARMLYRGAGAAASLHHQPLSGWSASARFAAYGWLSKTLLDRAEFMGFQEPDRSAEPERLELENRTDRLDSKIGLSEDALRSMLGHPLAEGPMTYALNCRGDHDVDFYSQPGLRIPVRVLRPGPEGCDPSRGAIIAVDDRGAEHLNRDEIVMEAVRRGWIVWMPDVRGAGPVGESMAPMAFGISMLLGENFTWRQSADILRVLRRVAGASSREPTVLYARGKTMSLAASYAAAIAGRNEIEWTVLRDAGQDFGEMKDAPLFAMPFHASRAFEIADLWRSAKAKVLVIRRPEEFLERLR